MSVQAEKSMARMSMLRLCLNTPIHFIDFVLVSVSLNFLVGGLELGGVGWGGKWGGGGE